METISEAAEKSTVQNVVRHDPKMRLHSHPRMEKDCKVPEGHVIIDYAVFFELVRIHGRYVVPNAAGDFPAVAGKVNRLVRNSESEKGERQ